MKDSYFAVAGNGRILEADSWEALLEKTKSQSDIEMYGAFFYDEPYIADVWGNGTHYYWPHIQILDANNRSSTYQKGIFKVKHIYKDVGTYYHKGRKVDLENCLTNEIISIHTPGSETRQYVTPQDFYYELMNILDKLNKEAAQTITK